MPTLRIAGLTVSLDGPAVLPRGWALLAPFLVGDVPSPDLRLAWRLGPAPVRPREAGEAVVTDLPGGGVSFVRWDFEGTLDPARGEGELSTSPSAGAVGAALRFAVALGLLEQSSRVELAALPPVEATRRLYAQVFRVGADPRRHARWLSLVADLVRSPGCAVLRFRREPSFWDVLAA